MSAICRRPHKSRSSAGLWCAIACCLLLPGCRLMVLDPAGPVGAAEGTILFDALAIMLAIVVPTILATLAFAWWFRASQHAGRATCPTGPIPAASSWSSGRSRSLVIMFLGGVTWIGSHDLDPAEPLAGADHAARGPGRLARLEVAVHLPRPGRRQRQPAGRAGRRAGAFPADLGQRDERVLRPAARQHDLHDERHGRRS